MKIFKGRNKKVFVEIEESTKFVYNRLRRRLPTDSLQRLALNFCIYDRPEKWLRVTKVESHSGILANDSGSLTLQLPHKPSLRKALFGESKEKGVKSDQGKEGTPRKRVADRTEEYKKKAEVSNKRDNKRRNCSPQPLERDMEKIVPADRLEGHSKKSTQNHKN